MKTMNSFAKNKLNQEAVNNVKGGYNIFCEIYIGRQEYKGEEVDQGVLSKLMVWDEGLNKFVQENF